MSLGYPYFLNVDMATHNSYNNSISTHNHKIHLNSLLNPPAGVFTQSPEAPRTLPRLPGIETFLCHASDNNATHPFLLPPLPDTLLRTASANSDLIPWGNGSFFERNTSNYVPVTSTESPSKPKLNVTGSELQTPQNAKLRGKLTDKEADAVVGLAGLGFRENNSSGEENKSLLINDTNLCTKRRVTINIFEHTKKNATPTGKKESQSEVVSNSSDNNELYSPPTNSRVTPLSDEPFVVTTPEAVVSKIAPVIKKDSQKPKMKGIPKFKTGRAGKPSTSGKNRNAFGHCLHCKQQETPEWRSGPEGPTTLCNACGLFYKKLMAKFGGYYSTGIMGCRRKKDPTYRKVPKNLDELYEKNMKL